MMRVASMVLMGMAICCCLFAFYKWQTDFSSVISFRPFWRGPSTEETGGAHVVSTYFVANIFLLLFGLLHLPIAIKFRQAAAMVIFLAFNAILIVVGIYQWNNPETGFVWNFSISRFMLIAYGFWLREQLISKDIKKKVVSSK